MCADSFANPRLFSMLDWTGTCVRYEGESLVSSRTEPRHNAASPVCLSLHVLTTGPHFGVGQFRRSMNDTRASLASQRASRMDESVHQYDRCLIDVG